VTRRGWQAKAAQDAAVGLASLHRRVTRLGRDGCAPRGACSALTKDEMHAGGAESAGKVRACAGVAAGSRRGPAGGDEYQGAGRSSLRNGNHRGGDGMGMVIAVCLGLLAAAGFGAASVLEQRSTKQVPQRAALSPRLLADLVRRPLFVAAIAVNVAGAGLQIIALHFGSLSLVQPLLVLSLLFAVVIAAVTIRRGPPDAGVLAGVACCAVGIAGFLAVARPHGGAGTAGPAAALPLAGGLAAVLAGCLAAARWGPPAARPLWLALGCGADFGVNALLLKIVPATLPAGFADPLRQWPLYLMVIVTPAGFLLNQNAFQAGSLIAPVLAVITTADPLVSVVTGAAFLHEKIAASAPDLAAEGLFLTVAAGGILALAQRAPQLAQRRDGGAGHALPRPCAG
jgi:drug/metabolite transporter (DMT)-like permease